jgi:3-hydroxybutyryl-CoA dehydrogenase
MSGKEQAIRAVAVIGAGNAGRSFAIACARAGFHVVLEDVMPANLRRAYDEFSSARQLGAPGASPLGTRDEGKQPGAPHLDSEMREKDPGSLTTALTVEDAVRTADLAIDFVPDELESKLEIFSMLDRMAPPRTILLTPTDAQSITDLASCTYRPTRCFAIRRFTGNALAPGLPAHLVHPPAFDPQALSATRDFLTALHCAVSISLDPIAPLLLKNQSPT